MKLNDIKKELVTSEYDFLRNNTFLGDNIILLGMGGSFAYGTNNENSDIDIRGIATNPRRNILIGEDFEQVVDEQTDTTIYSFDKMIRLLCDCNPNTIEILGLKPEHYISISDVGQQLLDSKKMFLSQKAAYSFGGYANAQLRRLENKAARKVSQSKQEENILKSIQHAEVDYKNKYFPYTNDEIKLFVRKSEREGYDSEIFCDINLANYPLRDFKDILCEMNAVVKAYSKIGKRNEKAIRKDKLGKHMMHLVRLYLMCFDILENEDIVTYRAKEHDFLMSIRNGAYLTDQDQPIPEFYEIVDEYEKRLEYDRKNTSLPENVDYKKIYDFVASVNENIVIKERY